MKVIPCSQNEELLAKIIDFAEVLKTQSHTLGDHGLSEHDFYQGVFRGAIERVRGQFSATTREKREFVRHVLNFMQDRGFIADWNSAGEQNRYDYQVVLPTGKVACIELKGCLDGNNTNIFERPAHAEEFILWSICTNPAADPQHNVWSGIHTRLSAEIIEHRKQVDGLLVWDWLCGSIARPCPKLGSVRKRLTEVGPYELPPPCIYLFPKTVPSARSNPAPTPHSIDGVEILSAFHRCFNGADEELNSVQFTVGHLGNETTRATEIVRDGNIQQTSAQTPIRRK